ncbi:MAG: 2-succinyl-5-enolpyruvyl-6-hydroxy-3-cyclohexene-1-carboxylic-acid synthase [Bacteroidetes bacterium]|nr:2-succinyl-5-enolpyruvyl-6-hydroxy-3-cyclohexene-1-carboxylic-acid synthase [Bacteroidota bacterium]
MNLLRQNLDYLALYLKDLGVESVVVSPGSRNAPIIAAFLRVGGFQLVSAPDERSAGFMAMGMGQAQAKPAAVLCTSGTAAANLLPAICEAYYQRVPLLAITADRPPEWIDQWDGQTIRQKGLFHTHVCGEFETPANLHLSDGKSLLAEICKLVWENCTIPHGGPVHLNIPLAEPLYEGLDQPLPVHDKLEFHQKPAVTDPVSLPEALKHSKKVLIVAGQHKPNAAWAKAAGPAALKFPLLADICSNLHGIAALHTYSEVAAKAGPELQPDILVTFGLSILSKNLKQYLRRHKPLKHYHINEGGAVGDPFQSMPETLRVSETVFLQALSSLTPDPEYRVKWVQACREAKTALRPNTEAGAVNQVLETAGPQTHIHLGNSMAVRWADQTGLSGAAGIWCNRGTSGIDGSLSTAAGFALAHPESAVVAVLGDISVLYDEHGFWSNPQPQNLKVVVLNNGGGQIFTRIAGPSRMPELLPWLQTTHHTNFETVANRYGLTYFQSNPDTLNTLLQQNGPLLIEIPCHNAQP